MAGLTRRDLLKNTAAFGAALASAPLVNAFAADPSRGQDMAFGLVTYLWGSKWDLPTLIANCRKANMPGVELRTTHAHKVELDLSPSQRAEVKKQFADGGVTNVGIGSAEEFHHVDPAKLKKAIEATKQYVKLSHDTGGSGVKVRPNALPKEVPVEKTIEQIGKSLNEVGAFGADFGQQIRLEVHGGCSRLSIIKQIMDVATHPNVKVCWNSNVSDLQDGGLVANFNLVKDRFGATAHVRALDSTDYPFADLIKLFVKADYRGWILLEGGGMPKDPLAAIIEQKALFDKMVAAAKA